VIRRHNQCVCTLRSNSYPNIETIYEATSRTSDGQNDNSRPELIRLHGSDNYTKDNIVAESHHWLNTVTASADAAMPRPFFSPSLLEFWGLGM
jgi:hypothetical protein